jgi:hypothetical protein
MLLFIIVLFIMSVLCFHNAVRDNNLIDMLILFLIMICLSIILTIELNPQTSKNSQTVEQPSNCDCVYNQQNKEIE